MRSSVLGGQVLTELTSSGAKQRTFVYSGSQVFAWQESPFGTPRVMWEHRDPSNASFRMSDINGSTSTGTDQEQPAELDPLGADSGTSNAYLIDPNPPSDTTSLLPYPSFSDPRHPGKTYTVDGIRVPADYFMIRAESLSTGGVEISANGTSSSAAANLGARPIYGRFGTQASSDGITTTWNWTTEITGYVSDGMMTGGLTPQVTPEIRGTKDKDAIRDFGSAFGETVDRLDNPDCANLFGGKEAALKALFGATYSYRDLGAAKYDPETQAVSVIGAATESKTNPPSVYINSSGPFRNTSILVFTSSGAQHRTLDFETGLRGAQFGALLLLHELGHLTGVFKADAHDAKLNREYTQKVQDACFAKKK